jgi:predicted phosphate transport protein (TIGR00153 family)
MECIMGGILEFLLPREKKFIKMLMKQSDIVLQGANEFNKFMIKFNDFDAAGIIEQRNVIKEIEHKGDYISRRIMDGLHETFITPLDREDILNLTNAMDDVLDYIDETAAKIVVYNAKKIPQEMTDFSEKLLEKMPQQRYIILKTSQMCCSGNV